MILVWSVTPYTAPGFDHIQLLLLPNAPSAKDIGLLKMTTVFVP